MKGKERKCSHVPAVLGRYSVSKNTCYQQEFCLALGNLPDISGKANISAESLFYDKPIHSVTEFAPFPDSCLSHLPLSCSDNAKVQHPSVLRRIPAQHFSLVPIARTHAHTNKQILLLPAGTENIKTRIYWFDVHRAVHRNIISIVKATRCTNVSNLFYFGMTLYMFRTVFPSIIRSLWLYIQQHVFVKQILLSGCQWVPASNQIAVSVWRMPVAICTVLNSWWWTERRSETCIVSFQRQNKFDTLVHLVGFTIETLLLFFWINILCS